MGWQGRDAHASRAQGPRHHRRGWKELTFTSFGRHGGATDSAASGLTEVQLMKKGQWSSTKAMPRYLHDDDDAKRDAQLKRIRRHAKARNP
jgi:hypothetical protein